MEVGAVPSRESLLCLKALNATERIGVNLDGPFRYDGFEIVAANANKLDFPDNHFDTVLCNATLEHHKRFWLSASEMRRVTKPGGLLVIGVPGYHQYRWEARKEHILRRLGLKHDFYSATLTYKVHNAAGDYYRFSEQAIREIFFEGMRDVSVRAILLLPRLIGIGRKP